MKGNLSDLAKNILCPPGHGVYTVNTAKERKEKLNSALYPEAQNHEQVQEKWISSYQDLENLTCTNILGICSDTGGGILRSANWGPLFIRLKLLEDLKHQEDFADLGDIRVIPHLLHDKYLNDETIASCRKALYGDEKAPYPVAPLSLTEFYLDHFYEQYPDKTIFALGGDHSISYPLVKSFLRAKKKQKKKIGLIHFDAHTDLLVERLGIDLCFGSWTSHILDDLQDPSHCFQIGIRSTGKPKEHWEKTFGLTQFWSEDVQKLGPETIVEKITEHYQKEGIEELYISFDIDALDSQFASSTGTPEEGGLEPHQAAIIIKGLLKNFPLSGADLMEVAPFLRTEQDHVTEPEDTLMSAQLISKILIEGLNRYAHL